MQKSTTASWLLASAMCLPGVLEAAVTPKSLHVFNWSDYIGVNTVSEFEKKSGIKVTYDVFDSENTLQAKLSAGNSGYDIVVPASYSMARQIKAGMYQKLDKAQIPNLGNLDPVLMGKLAEIDPGNVYGVPWAWGTNGLGYNLKQVEARLGKQAPLDSWSMLFDVAKVSRLKSCGVSVLDSPADVFPVVLAYLGKEPNSTNPTDYQLAYAHLKKIRPFITRFSSSGYINELANGSLCLAYGWSGDINIAKARAEENRRPYTIRYVIPQGGAPLWFSLMGVPKDAQNRDAAMRWINFILTPQVSADITNTVYYPTGNVKSATLVDARLRNDAGVYPPASVVSSLYLIKPLPPAITQLQTRLWTKLKAER